MHHFERVPLSQCWEEIDHVLKTEHWPEVGHFKDQPIDMDWIRYRVLEANGHLFCFTIRSMINEEFKKSELIGYAFYILDHHLHYQMVNVASQDILYVRKPYRGIGRPFINWCDNQMKNEGATTVIQHVKPYFNWSHILTEEMGYEAAELIFTRRL